MSLGPLGAGCRRGVKTLLYSHGEQGAFLYAENVIF